MRVLILLEIPRFLIQLLIWQSELTWMQRFRRSYGQGYAEDLVSDASFWQSVHCRMLKSQYYFHLMWGRKDTLIKRRGYVDYKTVNLIIIVTCNLWKSQVFYTFIWKWDRLFSLQQCTFLSITCVWYWIFSISSSGWSSQPLRFTPVLSFHSVWIRKLLS